MIKTGLRVNIFCSFVLTYIFIRTTPRDLQILMLVSIFRFSVIQNVDPEVVGGKFYVLKSCQGASMLWLGKKIVRDQISQR